MALRTGSPQRVIGKGTAVLCPGYGKRHCCLVNGKWQRASWLNADPVSVDMAHPSLVDADSLCVATSGPRHWLPETLALTLQWTALVAYWQWNCVMCSLMLAWC